MRYLRKTIDDFWNRLRWEYLIELRNSHQYHLFEKSVAPPIAIGDVVIVHDPDLPRGLWMLGKVENLIRGVDGMV